MEWDSSYLIYGVAVGWFTYHMFWMAMRIYQFASFPRTYGQTPNLTIKDLAGTAIAGDKELPAFRVIVPAYQEGLVIEGTLKRIAAMNYPQTHYEIYVATYADEPATAGVEATYAIVARVAEEINAKAKLERIKVLQVPAEFDGFFPGAMGAEPRYIGKARGLNYTLRTLYEENERSERICFIGNMVRRKHHHHVDRMLELLAKTAEQQKVKDVDWIVDNVFRPGGEEYIETLVFSAQLHSLLVFAQRIRSAGPDYDRARKIVLEFIAREAPRFYLELTGVDGATGNVQDPHLQVIQQKRFLYDVMAAVESVSPGRTEKDLEEMEGLLARTRPLLLERLHNVSSNAEIYELSRSMNSRWVMVYDADAHAPLDVMRHLAARILTEPDVMGFQGPVAPLLNYDDVHPLCRMGGLWMAFWHGAAYPRLLHNRKWAHPLAGTNWCFRVEGFEHDGKLTRNCAYEESRRRFLLYFDPTQLTEDLEVGIRNFSQWSTNANWHPLVETEQVPPTAKAMFAQHARWALGTLWTLRDVIRSRLPVAQKIWFLLYPVRVVFASSGPFVTAALIVAVMTEALTIEPVFAWWTLLLAFGNLVYPIAFIRTFERYFDMQQRAAVMEYIDRNMREIVAGLGDEHQSYGMAERGRLRKAGRQLDAAMSRAGFVGKYLQTRCTDDDEGVVIEDHNVRRYYDHLLAESPARIQTQNAYDAIVRLSGLLSQAREEAIPGSRGRGKTNGKQTGDALAPELTRLCALVDRAATGAGVNRWLRWSRYHTQILVWSIPFIYFSVTPFFNAFWRWLKGERGVWNKTARTPKV